MTGGRLKAFTLVELMLVAGICLIVVGLSLPILAPLVVEDELSDATSALASTLRCARGVAIRSAEVVYCAFVEDLSGSRVRVHRTLWGERGENWNPDWSAEGRALPDVLLPRGTRFADSNRRRSDPCALPRAKEFTPDGRYPVDRDSPCVVPRGSPNAFMFFRPDGSASADARIGILSRDGRLSVVRVERTTGAISVEDGP